MSRNEKDKLVGGSGAPQTNGNSGGGFLGAVSSLWSKVKNSGTRYEVIGGDGKKDDGKPPPPTSGPGTGGGYGTMS